MCYLDALSARARAACFWRARVCVHNSENQSPVTLLSGRSHRESSTVLRSVMSNWTSSSTRLVERNTMSRRFGLENRCGEFVLLPAPENRQAMSAGCTAPSTRCLQARKRACRPDVEMPPVIGDTNGTVTIEQIIAFEGRYGESAALVMKIVVYGFIRFREERITPGLWLRAANCS
jgi:hypothetical protein